MVEDLELVRRAKAGDMKAFSELVLRHQKALVRLALRYMKDVDRAEDVAQEAFIKAFQKLDTFEERSAFKSWLFRIAINTAHNRLRSEEGKDTSSDFYHVMVSPSAERDLVMEDIRKLLWSEIEKLPERQRTSLTLRIFEDLSFQEIAEIMDSPYDTAKANYRHALLKLKAAFEGTDLMKEMDRLLRDDEIQVRDNFLEVE